MLEYSQRPDRWQRPPTAINSETVPTWLRRGEAGRAAVTACRTPALGKARLRLGRHTIPLTTPVRRGQDTAAA